MKLWRVNVLIDFDMPVQAETQDEAEEIAAENYKEEYAYADFADFSAYELRKPGEFRGALPWGGDGSKTIDQLMLESSSDE